MIRRSHALTALLALSFGSGALAESLNIAYQGGAVTLDPHYRRETVTMNWQRHLFDTITTIDAAGKVKPGIARAWRPEGNDRWVLSLREGVKFHDGTPLTPADVVFSIERALNDPKSQFRSNIQAIKSAKATGKNTVEIITDKPDPLMPLHLSQIAVVPEKYVKAQGANWANKPVGTGPYKFVSWLAEDHLNLKSNPAYWGGAPKFEDVKLVSIPNSAARLAALLSGQVQIADKIAPQDVPRVEAANNFYVTQEPSTRVIYLTMDQGNKENSPGVGPGPNPFANPKVRQAVAYAIDKDLIVKSIMGGFAAPANQYVASITPGYDKNLKGFKADPEKAKKLLAEAGYPNGFDVRLDVPNDRYLNDALIGQAVGGMLKRVGINVKVNAVPKAVFFPQMDKGDFSMYIAGWSGSDGVETLQSQVMCKDAKEGLGTFNRAGYCNPEVDKLVRRASSTFNATERDKLLSQAMRTSLLDDVFWVPLHYEQVVQGVSDKLKWDARGDEYIFAWDVKPK